MLLKKWYHVDYFIYLSTYLLFITSWLKKQNKITRLFYKQHFFSTQTQCCLTFSWVELQMLLRCCLIDISANILRHILYLVFLCPCIGLSLFMSYLCDLFSFLASFSLSLIKYPRLNNRRTCFEYLLLFLDDNMDKESE